MKTTMWLIFAIVLTAVAPLWAQQANGTSPDEKQELVGPGDVLDIRVPAEPLLSKQYAVGENGKLYLPVLDEVDFGIIEITRNPDCKAFNCTVGELENIIKNRLKDFYQDTTVIIERVSYGTRSENAVLVYGEIRTSGSYRYTEGMKLLETLIKAGFVNDTADLKNIIIYRDGQRISVDISKLVTGDDFSNDIELKNGDYIAVPKKSDAQKITVYAMGKLGKFGKMEIPTDSYFIDALSEAGGPVGKAAVAKAYIIRNTDSQPTVIHVDLKALINRLDMSQNKKMANGDILFIPESKSFDVIRVLSDLSIVTYFKKLVEDEY